MRKTPANKGGRPSTYTEEVAVKILTRMMSGESLRNICADAKMPARSTVHLWIAKNEGAEPDGQGGIKPGTGFSDRYARAREVRADDMFDEMLEIADDDKRDWEPVRDKESGDIVDIKVDGEHIQRARLRVDTRKWQLSKMDPRKYGEKLDLGSDPERPLQHQHTIVRKIVKPGDVPGHVETAGQS